MGTPELTCEINNLLHGTQVDVVAHGDLPRGTGIGGVVGTAS